MPARIDRAGAMCAIFGAELALERKSKTESYPMELPPLYKFLDPHGARLTLINGTFKHAKPSDFNDLEDLTIGGVFQVDIEEALLEIQNNFAAVFLRHLNDEPTCSSPLKEKLKLIQDLYKENPELARNAIAAPKENIYDFEYHRQRSLSCVEEINALMQNYRVLCVTTDISSTYMWKKYAKEHTGVAVRIEPNIEKDSKFQLFRKVVYQESRPALYPDPIEFMSNGLFGNKEEILNKQVEKIIYAKTLNWQIEKEYRLVIPLGQNEHPWETLPYHAEEITELFLGSNMSRKEMECFVILAKARNSNIKIFIENLTVNGRANFERVF